MVKRRPTADVYRPTMTHGRIGKALVLVSLLSCEQSPLPPPTEPTLADLLVDESSGPLLASAYREQAPTPEDERLALVALVALVRSSSGGSTDPILLNSSFRDALIQAGARYSTFTGATQAPAGFQALKILARGAPEASVSALSATCDASCIPSGDSILRSTARLASRLTPARGITEAGALARLVLNLSSRRDIGTASVEQIRAVVTESMTDAELVDSLDSLGRIVVPAAALVQFGVDAGLIAAGTTIVPAAVTALAATVVTFGAGYALGSALNDAYDQYSGCRTWQEANCTHCGSDLLVAGYVCCSDGTQGSSCCGVTAVSPGNACCADETQGASCCGATTILPERTCCADGTQAVSCCGTVTVDPGNTCCTDGTQGASCCGLSALQPGNVCCGDTQAMDCDCAIPLGATGTELFGPQWPTPTAGSYVEINTKLSCPPGADSCWRWLAVHFALGEDASTAGHHIRMHLSYWAAPSAPWIGTFVSSSFVNVDIGAYLPDGVYPEAPATLTFDELTLGGRARGRFQSAGFGLGCISGVFDLPAIACAGCL